MSAKTPEGKYFEELWTEEADRHTATIRKLGEMKRSLEYLLRMATVAEGELEFGGDHMTAREKIKPALEEAHKTLSNG